MNFALILMVGLCGGRAGMDLDRLELQAISLVSGGVISGELNLCSSLVDRLGEPCLQIASGETRTNVRVTPIYPRAYLNGVGPSGSIFLAGAPGGTSTLALTDWPTPPFTSETDIDLEELKGAGRIAGARIHSSISDCDSSIHGILEKLSTVDLNFALQSLHGLSPLSPSSLRCLVAEVESNELVVVEGIEAPWLTFEAIKYHGHRTVGDLVLGILPVLTGAVLGNPPSSQSQEKRRDFMYAWLIWIELSQSKAQDHEMPASDLAK